MILTCSTCKKDKESTEFYKAFNKKRGFSVLCKKCHSTYSKNRRQTNPEVRAKSLDSAMKGNLKKLYGLTVKQYNDLLIDYNFECAICHIDMDDHIHRLFVDHNHATGVIRGILCRKCNAGLGNFNDDPELMRKAIAYVVADLLRDALGNGEML